MSLSSYGKIKLNDTLYFKYGSGTWCICEVVDISYTHDSGFECDYLYTCKVLKHSPAHYHIYSEEYKSLIVTFSFNSIFYNNCDIIEDDDVDSYLLAIKL